MRPWGMNKVSRWLGRGLGQDCGRCPDVTSGVLVSVYVQEMQTPRMGLSRSSRRILLTTSIWSVLVLVFAFFITYTVLLVCVDHPFHAANNRDAQLTGYPRSKVKFLGRNFWSRNGTSLRFAAGLNQRKKIWSSKVLNDLASSTPDCKPGTLFTIIITTSPNHFEHRTQIRNTWCNTELSNSHSNAWQCVFLIGQAQEGNTSSQLMQESLQHKDILRGSYLDSYRNLTLKVMHGLTWISANCESPYLLKTDDDCFVNVLLLWQFLVNYNTQTTNLYAGNMVVKQDKRHVIRQPNEKWSVSKDDYLPEYYPVYASGSGYIFSRDVVKKLVEESEFVKPIPNEDAYVGIVIDRLGIGPVLSGRFTLSSPGLRICNYKYIFVVHGVVPSMHQEMYNKMLAVQMQCPKEKDIKTWF